MRVLLLSLLLGAASAVPCTTKARTTGAPRSTVQDSTSVPGTVTTGVSDSSETVFTTVDSSTASTAGSTASGSNAPSTAALNGSAEVDLELVNAFSSTTDAIVFSSITTTVSVTPTPTTLPQVNVSYVQFTFADCVNGYCSYTYLAPKNDADLIADDDKTVDTDECIYEDDVVLVNNYNSSLEAIVLNATVQVDNLQQQLNYASDLLNQIVADLQATIVNINNATFYLNLPNSYVNNVAKGGSNDCFNRCTLPPTTPAPTTTPTPAPTTTQAFCDRPENNDYCTGHGECKIDSGGPYCNDCKGNEDKYQQCLASGCYPGGTNATAGPFWSPGYNGTGDMSAMPNGTTCVWNYAHALQMQSAEGSFNFTGLTSNANDLSMPYVTIIPLDGDNYIPIVISSENSAKYYNRQINNMIKDNGLTAYAVYLRTPTAPTVDQYFFWNFLPYTPTTTTKAASG